MRQGNIIEKIMSVTGAEITTQSADKNQMSLEPSAVDPATLAWAEFWYPIAWKGLIWAGGLTALGACATIAFLLLQCRTTSIRETQSEWRTASLELQTVTAKGDLAKSNERIAGLNAETARLSVEAETATKEIAIANAQTAEAKLQLEILKKQVGPRRIDRSAFLSVLEGGPKGSVEIEYGAEDQDSWGVALQLANLLKTAGWSVVATKGLPLAEVVAKSIVLPMNVKIETNSISDQETLSAMALSFGQAPDIRTPYVFLEAAISNGMERGTVGGIDSTLPAGHLRVIIFPR